MEIIKLRKKVDSLDSRVLKLLNERAKVILGIGKLKARTRGSIYVPEREKEVYKKLITKNAGPLSASSLKAIFREIINPRSVHQIPHRSNDVLLGLTNVHGELQLCFSLKALTGNEDAEQTDESEAKMLVIQSVGECWVFPVDQVLGVFRCNEGDEQNVPVTVSKASGTFTKKVIIYDQREVGLLDDELLIYTLQRRIS